MAAGFDSRHARETSSYALRSTVLLAPVSSTLKPLATALTASPHPKIERAIIITQVNLLQELLLLFLLAASSQKSYHVDLSGCQGVCNASKCWFSYNCRSLSASIAIFEVLAWYAGCSQATHASAEVNHGFVCAASLLRWVRCPCIGHARKLSDELYLAPWSFQCLNCAML